MNSRSLLLAAAALLLGSAQSARGEYQFTGSAYFPPGGVPDSLRQTVRFTLTPTQAGQDLRITFTPNGVISTGNNVGDVAAVPAPSGLVLVLCALPLLGAMWTRWSYGKRA